MSNLFVSLSLAAFMSFTATVFLISCAIAVIGVVGYIPGFWELSHQMTLQIIKFLAVFGNGKPLQGAITLGLTLSIVGVSLDLLNIYRYQSVKDRDI